MRLIDADVLTDELIKGMEADTDKSVQTTFTKSVCMILCKAIEQQPTINAVPVIRCRDCKHRPIGGHAYDHTLVFPDERCPCNCVDDNWYSWMPDDDWYCGNGERKKDHGSKETV